MNWIEIQKFLLKTRKHYGSQEVLIYMKNGCKVTGVAEMDQSESPAGPLGPPRIMRTLYVDFVAVNMSEISTIEPLGWQPC